MKVTAKFVSTYSLAMTGSFLVPIDAYDALLTALEEGEPDGQ